MLQTCLCLDGASDAQGEASSALECSVCHIHHLPPLPQEAQAAGQIQYVPDALPHLSAAPVPSLAFAYLMHFLPAAGRWGPSIASLIELVADLPSEQTVSMPPSLHEQSVLNGPHRVVTSAC